MNPIARRFLSMAAVVVTALACSSHAEAGLVVTLAPAGGSSPTDLSDVHVGDTLYFVTRGGSDAPVGTSEHLLSLPDIHLFADLDIFSVFQPLGYTGIWQNELHSNPNLLYWIVQPSAAGTVTLYNGFSDCNGLPDDTSGCAVTNLGATRPDDSNRITFTVFDVPEPSSVALVAIGAFALICSRRRKA